MLRALNSRWYGGKNDEFARRNAYILHMERFHVECLIDAVIETDIGWLLVRMYDDDYGFAMCLWAGAACVRVPMSVGELFRFPTADWASYIPF